MATKLVLLEDVEHLGALGEVVSVSEGYARNYLLPKKLARKANPGVLRQLAVKKERVAETRAAAVATAQELAGQLAAVSVTIPAQATDGEKLYGSVGAAQIAEALQQMKFTVTVEQILLAEPIRAIGKYPVDVRLHPEVNATVTVVVVKA